MFVTCDVTCMSLMKPYMLVSLTDVVEKDNSSDCKKMAVHALVLLETALKEVRLSLHEHTCAHTLTMV